MGLTPDPIPLFLSNYPIYFSAFPAVLATRSWARNGRFASDRRKPFVGGGVILLTIQKAKANKLQRGFGQVELPPKSHPATPFFWSQRPSAGARGRVSFHSSWEGRARSAKYLVRLKRLPGPLRPPPGRDWFFFSMAKGSSAKLPFAPSPTAENDIGSLPTVGQMVSSCGL